MNRQEEMFTDEPIRAAAEALRSSDNVVLLRRRDSHLQCSNAALSCSSAKTQAPQTRDEPYQPRGFRQEIKNASSPDLYCEDDCGAGPRPFTTPIKADGTSPFPQDTACSEIICVYNQALSLHGQNLTMEAAQLYEIVSLTVHNLIHSAMASGCLLELGMKSYNNFATIAFANGDDSSAITGIETSLLFAHRLANCFSDFRLDYASVLSNLCHVLWKRGDISASLYHGLGEVLRIRSAALPWNHQDVAAAYYNIAAFEYATNQTEQASSNLMQYLEIAACRSKSGVVDLDPIPALTYLLLLQNKDKDDRSSKELVRGLRALQEKRLEHGPESAEVASILNFVGTLLFHKGDLDHALLFFQEELRLEQQLMEFLNDISVAVTCNNVGRILQELGNYQEAVKYYKLALSDGLCSNGVDPKDSHRRGRSISQSTSNLYSTVWYNLGLIHDKLGAYPDAIVAFINSLELRKAMLGNDHPDIACLHYNIGVLQMEQQQLDEAFLSFSEALRIRYHGAGNQLNDERVIKTLEKLATLYKEKGNIEGAVNASGEILKVLNSSKNFSALKRSRDSALLLRSIAELHHAGGNMVSALSAAQNSVDKFHTLFSEFKSIENSKSKTMYTILEHLAISLVLLGSLYHELSEPVLADRVLLRAVGFVDTEIRASDASSVPTSLRVLRDVAAMLANNHCAPEA